MLIDQRLSSGYVESSMECINHSDRTAQFYGKFRPYRTFYFKYRHNSPLLYSFHLYSWKKALRWAVSNVQITNDES